MHVHGDDGETLRAERRERIFRPDVPYDGHMEDRTGRRTHALRVVGVDRAPREHDSRGTRGVRRPEDRPRVARITHVVEDGHRTRRHQVVDPHVHEGRDPDDALGCDGGGEPFHHAFADLLDRHSGLPRTHGERIQLVADEERQETTVLRERLCNRLRTFDEEAMLLFTEGSLLQTDRRDDLLILRRRQHDGPRTGRVYVGPERSHATTLRETTPSRARRASRMRRDRGRPYPRGSSGRPRCRRHGDRSRIESMRARADGPPR